MQNLYVIEDVFVNKSYRQIVGDMLDNSFHVIRLFISSTLQIDGMISENGIIGNIPHLQCSTMMKEDLQKAMKDLYGALNFLITYYDRVLKHRESKTLKTLIFELKHFRNNWAHSKDFTLREVYRQ